MARPTLDRMLRELHDGRASAQAYADAALSRIAAPDGEGPRAFIHTFAEDARRAAAESDARRRRAEPLRPLEGIPVSIKDLCDVAGVTTLAGSRVRRDEPPATSDALVVERLRAAGAVIVGTTNMSEFALGTVGTNAHYGTPRNPWDRATGRIPGGSSSGAAVSVADDMCAIALGSDTAGSIRVPAALCGLTGFKPTARRVPLIGIFPLSPSLDSVGPIARTVSCCAHFDAVLAAEPVRTPEPRPLASLRMAALQTLVLDDLEPAVAAAYDRSLRVLRHGGARIVDLELPPVADIPALFTNGGISGAEAYRYHRPMLERAEKEFDPIVARRLRTAAAVSDEEYRNLLRTRRALIHAAGEVTRDFDAVLMPTCPLVAPTIAAVQDLDQWQQVHRRLLYANAIANVLDRCALTLPLQPAGEPPVGLTLMGEAMADHDVLEIGLALEQALSSKTS